MVKQDETGSKRLVRGVGVNDYTGSTYEGGVQMKSYVTWTGMLRRCYSKELHQRQPTYEGCSVSKDWLYYSKFKKWFDDNYIEGYQLDKDYLVADNKIYSDSTCIFIPQWLNKFIISNEQIRGSYPVGVSWNKRNNKYNALIRVNGKLKNLGTFDTSGEAYQAWLSEKLKLALGYKSEMDKIDLRIYPRTIEIIYRLK